MFNKGTLTPSLENLEDENSTFFYNTAMYTPGTTENIIPTMDQPKASGEAMITTGDIKYYPVNGNFDFFGYHIDDALPNEAEIDNETNPNLWTVPFEIDGSQDLMSTKAEPTEDDLESLGESTDFYSAKAARKSVHPTLTFKHLLSRLSFVAVAGNDKAAGCETIHSVITKAQYDELAGDAAEPYHVASYTFAAGEIDAEKYGALSADEKAALITVNNNDTPDDTSDDTYSYKAGAPTTYTATAYENLSEAVLALGTYTPATYAADIETVTPTNAVKINSIQVKSKTTGKLVVAWKNPDEENPLVSSDADKIAFDDEDEGTWLTLKDRPAYQKVEEPTDETLDADDFTDLKVRKDALDPEADDYEELVAELNTAANGRYQNKITATTWGLLTEAAKANYEAIENKEKENLIALTPTSPQIDTDETGASRYPETQIGEALIVAPKSVEGDEGYEGYEMKVSLSQYVKSNWNPTPDGTYEEKTQTATYTIKAPVNDGLFTGATNGFLQNVSYKVKLTVYGWERIVVTAVVEPWIQGETLEVGQDGEDD